MSDILPTYGRLLSKDGAGGPGRYRRRGIFREWFVVGCTPCTNILVSRGQNSILSHGILKDGAQSAPYFRADLKAYWYKYLHEILLNNKKNF